MFNFLKWVGPILLVKKLEASVYTICIMAKPKGTIILALL